MATHLTKYFGEIDLSKPNQWYETEIERNEQTIEISMVCSKVAINLYKEKLQEIDSYIDNFDVNESNIRLILTEDFSQKGATKDYIDAQIEEQHKENTSDSNEMADRKIAQQEKLLSDLTLLRVEFYPESEDKMFAVFDYIIDEILTDDLLAVKLYKDSSIIIDIES